MTSNSQTDVVVIGGGIAGVTAAYYLARNGLSVVLLEKGRIAGEQSSRNWGWVRKQGRDPRELEGAILSLKLWEELHQQTGQKTGFVKGGIAYLAADHKKLASFEQWLEIAREYQLDTKILSARETETIAGNPAYIGALVTPSDARAEPAIAVPAIASMAQQCGTKIQENTAVRSLLLEGGQVRGVITEKGEIRAKSVILAGGVWSSLFLRHHGVDLPQLGVRASVLRTHAVSCPQTYAMGDERAAFRPRADGGVTIARSGSYTIDIGPDHFRYFRHFMPYLKSEFTSMKLRLTGQSFRSWQLSRPWSEGGLSPFERCRTLDPKPDQQLLNDVFKAAKEQYPHLRDVKIAESWAGMIDVVPDGVPVIGPVEALPGLLIATGMSGHGFGFGPAAGLATAHLAQGLEPPFDLKSFRLSRFYDGSVIEPFDL